MKDVSFLAVFALLAAPAALAQAPEIIAFDFDAMDVSNAASPGYGGAATNMGLLFNTSAACGGGFAAESPGTGTKIETNWTLDLGMSSWSVGMIIDLEAGGNAFQYFFGSFTSASNSLRCFCNGASGQDNIMLRSPGGDIVLNGATALGAPHHIVFVYDSVLLEIRGYLDGVLVETVPQSLPLDLNATAPDFHVGGYNSGSMVAGNQIDEFRFYRRAIDLAEITNWGGCIGGGGTNYCMAEVNSTGVAASIGSTGSISVASNSLVLTASDLPANSFAFFITSQTQSFVMNPGGSAGNLCLAGAVGRYVGPGQIQQANGGGQIDLAIDLTMTPQPNGFVSVQAGEVWNFQVWYRDSAGGMATSNFTDGLEVTFN